MFEELLLKVVTIAIIIAGYYVAFFPDGKYVHEFFRLF